MKRSQHQYLLAHGSPPPAHDMHQTVTADAHPLPASGPLPAQGPSRTCRVIFASWLSRSAPLNTAPIWSLTGSARVLMRTRRAPSVVVYSSAHCRYTYSRQHTKQQAGRRAPGPYIKHHTNEEGLAACSPTSTVALHLRFYYSNSSNQHHQQQQPCRSTAAPRWLG